MSWRLIDIGPCDAARNMALDDVLLESRSKELVPNTFRFLQFNPSAVLVGYHQSVENEVRVEYCNRKGLEINRRLTGGGAILFDPTSLGWEIIASKRDFGIERNFFDQEKLFNRICDGAINGLKSFGINAKFRPKNDIEVNGKKISGTGGTEREGAFLFQGTLLVDVDVEMMLHALKIPLEKLKDKEIASVRERVTTVYKELGSAPSITVIKRALIGGFQQSLGTEFTQSGLIHEE
ncbi:MAG TPA: lipoate--protein ligase family protein, partial [Candidatus Bathyarchaeia archaeon]|nr:lipoate--protein ligase family protein [Candidatus Bathyarchaeia archaeon]